MIARWFAWAVTYTYAQMHARCVSACACVLYACRCVCLPVLHEVGDDDGGGTRHACLAVDKGWDIAGQQTMKNGPDLHQI